MARSEDAAKRGELLRAKLEETVDAGGDDATVSPTELSDSAEIKTWEHIPAQQILVVRHDGEEMGAVTVDTDEGRVLFSQETSPCPTCGQEWTRGARLDGNIEIVWPKPYKT